MATTEPVSPGLAEFREACARRDAQQDRLNELAATEIPRDALLEAILSVAREQHAPYRQYDGHFESRAGWKLAKVTCEIAGKGGRRFAARDFVASRWTGLGMVGERETYSVRGGVVCLTSYGILEVPS